MTTQAVSERVQAEKRPSALLLAPIVVVAEDDAELREEICSVLRDDGFEVVGVADGEGLVGYLGTCEMHGRLPDVIVSDHGMPGYTGLEILEVLKHHGWTTPMIIISGQRDGQLLASFANAFGAKAYLSKPLSMRRLRAAVYQNIDWTNRRLERS